MILSITFKNRRRHAVTTNENVFHLAELGRLHRLITCYIGVFFFDVGHIRVLPVWGEAITTGKNSYASSDRF
jgi:hypothetical protein